MSRDIKTRSKDAILRQIIDLNPNMIFAKDRSGRFLLVNRAVADSLGMTVEELTGRLHSDVHPDSEEVERMLAADRKVIDSGEPMIIPEESYRDSSGNRRWLQTIKVPFVAADTNEPAVLGVAVDISDAKRTENALRESEQRYKLLFENARCPITVFDREGTVLMINSTSAMMFGMPAESIIGMSIRDILPGQAEMILDRNRRVLETGRGQEFEDALAAFLDIGFLAQPFQPGAGDLWGDGQLGGTQVFGADARWGQDGFGFQAALAAEGLGGAAPIAAGERPVDLAAAQGAALAEQVEQAGLGLVELGGVVHVRVQ
jgi:PAS domain S-box-containing protein